MTQFVITHLVIILPGCFYDWEVGPSETSSSSSVGGAGGAGGTSATGGTGGISGTGGTGGADCTALSASLETARANAKACMFGQPAQCTASIDDERGCKSWLNNASSTQANAFRNAVMNFTAAGCTPSTMSCLTSPPSCLYVAGKPTCVP